MTQPSLRTSVMGLSIILVVLVDGVLRWRNLVILGFTPSTWDAFQHLILVPEIINAVIVGVVLMAFTALIRSTILVSLIAALATTAAHRWNVGSKFPPSEMNRTIIIFTILTWLSLVVAQKLLDRRVEKN